MIKMTQEYADQCRLEFDQVLKMVKMSDGKFNYTKPFADTKRRATVYFTPNAWAKMVALINESDKEVAWHGVAHRMGEAEGEQPPEGDDREYVITDILVYPQTVTSVTVDMDEMEYAKWLMANADDERFDHIRMQGHSHVRMGTTPSSTDIQHQETILDMLGDDDFYIFMIWNQMFSSNVKVYDMAENTLFESTDVTVRVIGMDENLDEFIQSAKSLVKAYTYTAPAKPAVTPAASVYNPLRPEFGEKPRTRIGAGWRGKDACPQGIYDDEAGYDDFPHRW
jgi:hypothetical protein